ncbi:hypothetical protein DFJ73DRAFT_809077 [Zopfochytrium polystomum]|nr:hypothetical protein DFJ73DRAFT_809077 [Zopfochytrium polystomum]
MQRPISPSPSSYSISATSIASTSKRRKPVNYKPPPPPIPCQIPRPLGSVPPHIRSATESQLTPATYQSGDASCSHQHLAPHMAVEEQLARVRRLTVSDAEMVLTAAAAAAAAAEAPTGGACRNAAALRVRDRAFSSVSMGHVGPVTPSGRYLEPVHLRSGRAQEVTAEQVEQTRTRGPRWLRGGNGLRWKMSGLSFFAKEQTHNTPPNDDDVEPVRRVEQPVLARLLERFPFLAKSRDDRGRSRFSLGAVAGMSNQKNRNPKAQPQISQDAEARVAPKTGWNRESRRSLSTVDSVEGIAPLSKATRSLSRPRPSSTRRGLPQVPVLPKLEDQPLSVQTTEQLPDSSNAAISDITHEVPIPSAEAPTLTLPLEVGTQDKSHSVDAQEAANTSSLDQPQMSLSVDHTTRTVPQDDHGSSPSPAIAASPAFSIPQPERRLSRPGGPRESGTFQVKNCRKGGFAQNLSRPLHSASVAAPAAFVPASYTLAFAVEKLSQEVAELKALHRVSGPSGNEKSQEVNKIPIYCTKNIDDSLTDLSSKLLCFQNMDEKTRGDVESLLNQIRLTISGNVSAEQDRFSTCNLSPEAVTGNGDLEAIPRNGDSNSNFRKREILPRASQPRWSGNILMEQRASLSGSEKVDSGYGG